MHQSSFDSRRACDRRYLFREVMHVPVAFGAERNLLLIGRERLRRMNNEWLIWSERWSNVACPGGGLTGGLSGVYVTAAMKQIKMALTDRQIKTLKKEAVTLGISFSELIRRILDRHLDEKK
jgi:hypothetical protein